MLLINEREPVIIPYWDQHFFHSLLVANPQLLHVPGAPDPKQLKVGGNSFWARNWGKLLLILLCLLALGGGFWWAWMNNLWGINPFIQDRVQKVRELEQQVRDHQQLATRLEALLEKNSLRQDVAYELLRQRYLMGREERLASDRITTYALSNLIFQIKSLERNAQAHKEAQEAKEAAEAAEAAAAAAQAAAAKPKTGGGKDSAAKGTTTVTTAKNTKALPKCSTVKKQGKIPELIMAMDGSGSMIRTLPDGRMRITAAVTAGQSLVDKVDKNVPIRLLAMQGCPLVRDYGVFFGNQRSALKSAIAATTPLNAPIPPMVTTPLISALRSMATTVDAKTETVGILISDGVDTCDGTERLDLCQIASDIHQMRPLLKINVVLIGEDAPKAQCIADITGGKVYRPQNTVKLITDLQNAAQTLEKICTD